MQYRVWCENKNKYEQDDCFLTPDGRLFQQGAYGNMQPLSLKMHKIEKCTGLKDKNGQLIFEGDKVNANTYNKYEEVNEIREWTVEYMATMHNQRFVCYGDDRRFNTPLCRALVVNTSLEIIGNIHD